jgi:polar amino acid transport system substrate-binding protein
MKMKRFLAIAAAIIMIVALAGCQASTDSWARVQEKGKLVLGFDEAFPPMGFKDDAGNHVGFDIDVATEVCKRLDIQLQLQPINWDSKEQELNSGNIDCIWNGFTIKDEYEGVILFTKPYMANQQVLVVQDDSGYNTLSDLAGKKLGLQAGSSAANALASDAQFKDSMAQVIELEDNMTALLDLEKGGVDAVLLDEIVARYYITTSGKPFRVLDESLAAEEYGVGFRIDDVELKDKIESTMVEMHEDGTLAKISEKWFLSDITTIGK